MAAIEGAYCKKKRRRRKRRLRFFFLKIATLFIETYQMHVNHVLKFFTDKKEVFFFLFNKTKIRFEKQTHEQTYQSCFLYFYFFACLHWIKGNSAVDFSGTNSIIYLAVVRQTAKIDCKKKF